MLKYAVSKKLIDAHQIDKAIEFIKEKGDFDLTEQEFESNVGVSINIKYITIV